MRLPNSAGQPGERGGDRPEAQPQGEGAIGVDALDQPPREELTRRIGPEEGRDQDADLACGEMQGVLDEGRGSGHVASIDVVYEHRQGEQPHHAPSEPAGACLPHALPFSTCFAVIKDVDAGRVQVRAVSNLRRRR